MGYNTMGTSTYTKELQITEYEPNVSEITTVPKTMITRYGADIPKRYSTTYLHSTENQEN